MNREPNGVKETEGSFHWVDRQHALERLGNINPQVFSHALLLAHSNIIGIFPVFKSPAFKDKTLIKEAVDALVAAGGNLERLCAQIPDPTVRQEYLVRYKRAIAGVHHNIVITAEGDVAPLRKEKAPSDIHEFIGLRLPEELYTYLLRGVIQPQILNWLTSGVINVTSPAAGAEAMVAQRLAGSQLDPLRRRAVTVLAEPIHRYFQTKEISTKLWFDRDNDIKFTARSIQPSPRSYLTKWNVHSSLFEQVRPCRPGLDGNPN